MRTILHKPELSGRLTKWAIELTKYDITYAPRTAVKSQVLVDFVADFTQQVEERVKEEVLNASLADEGTWILFVDGSSCSKGSGLGIVLHSPVGDVIE